MRGPDLVILGKRGYVVRLHVAFCQEFGRTLVAFALPAELHLEECIVGDRVPVRSRC